MTISTGGMQGVDRRRPVRLISYLILALRIIIIFFPFYSLGAWFFKVWVRIK